LALDLEAGFAAFSGAAAAEAAVLAGMVSFLFLSFPNEPFASFPFLVLISPFPMLVFILIEGAKVRIESKYLSGNLFPPYGAGPGSF